MAKELKPENVFAVGVDPSKDTLWVVGMKFPEVILFSRSIENVPEEYEKLDAVVQRLAVDLGLEAVYGLEDTGMYGKAFCDWLCARGRVVKEVNPIRTSRQKAFYGQDKSDEADAICAAAIVLRSLHALPDRKALDGAWQALKELSTFRDAKVKQRNQLLCRLHHYLGRTWLSLYQEFFSGLNQKAALAFFRRYPNPQALKGGSRGELARLLFEATGGRFRKRPPGTTPREAAEQKAKVILTGAARLWERPVDIEVEAVSVIIVEVVDPLVALNESVARIEAEIGRLVERLGVPLKSITGIGYVRAGVILGQTGDPGRFKSTHAYAKYNGTAPRQKGSGKIVRHVKNYSCNRRLRQEFRQLALYMASRDPMSKEYADRLIKEGKTKGQALNRLARRLSDIVFAIMCTGKDYDPEIARRNMHRKMSRKERLKLVS